MLSSATFGKRAKIMLNSSDYAKNYASTIGKSLHPTWRANFSPYKHFWLGQPVQLGEGEMIRACASAVGAGKGCTVLWYKWPVHDLVLVIPPSPLGKVANNTRS